MRKALIVGIDDYDFSPLKYCVKDAKRMTSILSKNYDSSPNFDCRLLVSSEDEITESMLKRELSELFKNEADVVLFYFSGHGSEDNFGGSLVTQDATPNDTGLGLKDIILLANQSEVGEIIILLDCCYSGQIGNSIGLARKGVSVLASSSSNQTSLAKHEGGLFTSIIYDAINGFASDILGNITVTDVYNYADKLLGPWDQRPIFKAYLSRMISLRKCKPKIELSKLRKLATYFNESIEQKYQLSPAYEPTEMPRNEDKEAIFAALQKMTSLNLIEPIDEEHMYYVAINNGYCQLTPLGKYYWTLIVNNRI